MIVFKTVPLAALNGVREYLPSWNLYGRPETTETPSNKTTTIHRNTGNVDEAEVEEANDDTDGEKRANLQEDVAVVAVAVATSNGVVDGDDDAVVVGGDFNCGNAFRSKHNDDLAFELELAFALVLKLTFLRRYLFCLAGLLVTGPNSISFDEPFNDALPVDSLIA